jgi:hypothetical protein
MKRMITMALAIFAVAACSSLGLAQRIQQAAPLTARTETAMREKRLHQGSPELTQVFADQKFLDACAILATSGEMFLVDSAVQSSDGKQSFITFTVVTEGTKEPGQYKQLVYEFDGKDRVVYFNDRNDRYQKLKSTPTSTSKMKWPPSWWPGSGGGSTGLGGGFDWEDWHQVSIDNCHANFACPFVHVGKMRQEERASKANPAIKQTRWILVSCGCS